MKQERAKFIIILLIFLGFISCNSIEEDGFVVNNLTEFNSAVSHAKPGDQKFNIDNLWDLNPEFEKDSYRLADKSKLKGKGTDQLDLGVILK